MHRSIDAMLNQRPRQRFDNAPEDLIFSDAQALDYSPLLTQPMVEEKLRNEVLPKQSQKYGKSVIDNRRLKGVDTIRGPVQLSMGVNLLKAPTLSLSQEVINSLLNKGINVDPDNVATFRNHLRGQGVVFLKAKSFSTVVKPYYSPGVYTDGYDIYEHALAMARLVSGVKAPKPIGGRVSFRGRVVSVSNLDLAPQAGSTTYSMTPVVVCNHWVSSSTFRKDRKVIPLYSSSMNHTPTFDSAFTAVAKNESWSIKELANGLGFDPRALSKLCENDGNSQLHEIHSAMRVSLLPSDYDLRLIKACVLYLAAISSPDGNITVKRTSQAGIPRVYTPSSLSTMFNNNEYTDNTIILYADTPDDNYCTFLRMLVGEVSGDTVQSGRNRLYLGGYVIPSEGNHDIVFISKSRKEGLNSNVDVNITANRVASWVNRYARGVGITKCIPHCLIIASILMAGEIIPNVRLPRPVCRQDLFAAKLDNTGKSSILLSTKPSDYIWVAGITLATQIKLMLKDVIAHEVTSVNSMGNMVSSMQSSNAHRFSIYEYYAETAFHTSLNIARYLDPLFITEDLVDELNQSQVIDLMWARIKYGVVNANTWLQLAQTAKMGKYDDTGFGTSTETAHIGATIAFLGGADTMPKDSRSIPHRRTKITPNALLPMIELQQINGNIRIIDDGIDPTQDCFPMIDLDAYPEVLNPKEEHSDDSDSDSDESEAEDSPEKDDVDEDAKFEEEYSKYMIAEAAKLDAKLNPPKTVIDPKLSPAKAPEDAMPEQSTPKVDKPRVVHLKLQPTDKFNKKWDPILPYERSEANKIFKIFMPKMKDTGSFSSGGNWLELAAYIKGAWKQEGKQVRDLVFDKQMGSEFVLRESHAEAWRLFMFQAIQTEPTLQAIKLTVFPNAPDIVKLYMTYVYERSQLVVPCWLPVNFAIRSGMYVKQLQSIMKHIGISTVDGQPVYNYNNLPLLKNTEKGYEAYIQDLAKIKADPGVWEYTRLAMEAFYEAVSTSRGGEPSERSRLVSVATRMCTEPVPTHKQYTSVFYTLTTIFPDNDIKKQRFRPCKK